VTFALKWLHVFDDLPSVVVVVVEVVLVVVVVVVLGGSSVVVGGSSDCKYEKYKVNKNDLL
jgi:hypothetical protein